MRKYIFPGGYTPALSEVLAAIEKVGLWVTDIEILRLHYAETLRHWRQRFLANRERIKQMAGYDERFCRMWEFYLAGCEVAFRYMNQMVFQMQLATPPGRRAADARLHGRRRERASRSRARWRRSSRRPELSPLSLQLIALLMGTTPLLQMVDRPLASLRRLCHGATERLVNVTRLPGAEDIRLREPPHNFEAEQALLGAILINNAAYQRVAEFLRPEHFADPLHGKLFDSLSRLIERGQIVERRHAQDLCRAGRGA